MIERVVTSIGVVESTGWQIDSTLGSMVVPMPTRRIRQPKKGDRIRLYTVDGLPALLGVRGVVFNDDIVFYQTLDEYRDAGRREAERRIAADRERFESERESLDARYNALPDVFRQRIEKFRRTNPDFRWQHERYEIFCCEQAVLIASTLEYDEQRIETFKKADPLERQAMVPDLSAGLAADGSDNTVGCAVALAKAYATDPAYVVLIHGALSYVYSCERYGCPHPVPLDLVPGGATTMQRIEREVRERLTARAAAAAAPVKSFAGRGKSHSMVHVIKSTTTPERDAVAVCGETVKYIGRERSDTDRICTNCRDV